MYKAFYGLSRQPFDNTPNPEFFFASKQHREALAALVYGIEQCKGFMLVTGEVGSGKTFLIQSLKYELEEQNHIILEVATPWITPEELFAELPAKLGMDMTPEWGSLVFQNKLKAHLTKLHEQGRRVLVILDEAQQLPERTLEGIRLLSNFETAEAKLIQIIFLGQNELVDMLSRYSMRQIRQRITLSRALGYFNDEETASYITHRLKIAGRHLALFDKRAMAAIYRYSGGSPRLINQICDNALITGFAQSAPIIGEDVINEVASDLPNLDINAQKPKTKRVVKRKVAAEKSAAIEQALADVDPPVSVKTNGLRTEEVGAPGTTLPDKYAATDNAGSTYDRDYEAEQGSKGKSSLWFWLLLILLLVGGWYLAQWYQDYRKMDDQQETGEMSEAYQSPSSGQVELNNPVMEPKWPLDSSSTDNTDKMTGNNTSTGSPSVVDVQELSLFERLRREARIVDGYEDRTDTMTEPAVSQNQPDWVPAARAVTKDSMGESTNEPPRIKESKTARVIVSEKVVDVVKPIGAQSLIDLPQGVITSSRPPALLESGKRYSFPDESKLASLTQSPRLLRAGETVSELARIKYTTWNDTVQDIVRSANPHLPSDLNMVMNSSKVNYPNVTRADLVFVDDKGVFAYMGTLTSRLKANHLYRAVEQLGQSVDMQVQSMHGRRYYRVFAGPYASEAEANEFLQSVRMNHMPFLD